MGIESWVVISLAIFEPCIPIVHLRIPIYGLYFNVEVRNRKYEFGDCSKLNKQRMPEVLIQLGKFKMINSKSGLDNRDH